MGRGDHIVQGVGPGSVLAGRYAVTLRTLEGAHHERWRATDQTLERDVVLVCFPSWSPFAAAALDAARRAAGLEDPRLVRVLDVGSDRDTSFIVEEPLTGSAELAYLLHDGGLPAEEVRRLVGESASALEKARQRGLHHLALTPHSILRMPDGSVKVRGLATDAALLDTDSAADDLASRLDAIGLVRLVYAGLTARWPGAAPAGARAVAAPGLETAPTMVGGVASPSEIAVGVPADLDLICRLTLTDDAGPVSPGDLANQIAPWPHEAPIHDGATVMGLPRPARGGPSTRVMPATVVEAGAGGGRAAGHAGNGSAGPLGAAGAAGAMAAGAAGAAKAGVAAGTPGAAGAGGLVPSGEEHRLQTQLAAAGAAAVEAASVIGDKVGSLARAAAEKASARAAERRAAHHDEFEGEDVALSDALEEGSGQRLEPPMPMLGQTVPEAPSRMQSRVALAIVGVLVLVALVVGIQNVMKIGQHDGPVTAPAVTTPSSKSSPSASATTPPQTATSTSAPPTTAANQPIEIVGGAGFDPEGNEDQGDAKAKLAFDGDPNTQWQSRWFGSDNYNGSRSGVGLVLDLSGSVTIKQVKLTLPAAQDVTVYAANAASLSGAQEIGSTSGKSGTITIKAPDGLKPASKLIVWITKMAPAEAPTHYRAQVSEVVVS